MLDKLIRYRVLYINLGPAVRPTINGRDLRRFEIRFEFESDDSDSIQFESDGLIRNFESAAPAVVPQTTLTVQLKSQPFRRCNGDLFYVYDF